MSAIATAHALNLSYANAAGEMGGTFEVDRDGADAGAAFTRILPPAAGRSGVAEAGEWFEGLGQGMASERSSSVRWG
jgi:hypothetical protein